MPNIVIHTDGSEYLSKPCRKVTFPLKDEEKLVIQNLKDTLKFNKRATGVAAPQIGSSISALIYKCANQTPDTIMINPEIIKARDLEKHGKLEMCLSFPERIFSVQRYKNITVRFQDEYGEFYILKYRDLEARIIQHEIDHLYGITIADRGKELDEETTQKLLGGLNEQEK